MTRLLKCRKTGPRHPNSANVPLTEMSLRTQQIQQTRAIAKVKQERDRRTDDDASPYRDEIEAAAAFSVAAKELLSAAEEMLVEARHGREETRALLDRLEARLASHG
jgi:hypothetical protein